MKYFKLLVIPGIIFLLLMQACTSPMDVDTPRDKKPVFGEDYKMTGEISEMFFEENGTVKSFTDNHSYFKLDTAFGTNNIWMHLKLDDVSAESSKLKRISIKKLDITLDSICFNKPYKFDGRLSGTSKCGIQIARGVDASKDTTSYAGQSANCAEITFNLNKEKGELLMFLHSKVYENKIWIEYRDSTYIDYITVIRLDSSYVNGILIVREVKEKIPKTVTVKLEEEKRKKDSLFLNGKFKLKF